MVGSLKVHLHASCWNEERMLPFFFRHYDPFVDRYFIRDNGSTDNTLAILAAHPKVTVLPLVLDGDSLCEAAFAQVNSFWHCSRGEADWVAVCNIDEFFWHPDLSWYLQACHREGVTFIPSKGYEMLTHEFPSPDENLAETRRVGAPNPGNDKPSFFNPDAITDSGFGMARHKAAPQGRVFYPDKREMLMLHYKHLGLEYLTARHAELGARMRPRDRERQLGFHYDPEYTRRRFDELWADERIVVPPPDRRPQLPLRVPKAVPPSQRKPNWSLRIFRFIAGLPA